MYAFLYSRIVKVQPEFVVLWPINHCRLSYLPTPPLGKDMTQGQFLSGV